MENAAFDLGLQHVAGGAPYMEFLLRLCLDLAMIFIVVRLVYYPRHKNKDFVFTFSLFNTINFLICFLLSTAKLTVGFAFGLFAIFSIIRYRTVTVPVREMGYFFVCIAVGLINALAGMDGAAGIATLLLVNALIVVTLLLLEHRLSLEHENCKEITYERIELIKPSQREAMLDDLRQRTGLPIHRVEILKVDFLRDVARVNAFYFSAESESAASGGDEDD
ncbi:MAG: DUF4956 domain-containing protein [Ignavibacteria bacterium]